MEESITPVAIIGATGAVGQKLIRLIDAHPNFIISEVSASDHNVGKKYADATLWRESTPLSKDIAHMTLLPPLELKTPIILSALPAKAAKVIELELVKKGHQVISNASAFRMKKDVPLLIPEINLDHLLLIESQRTTGCLITNPNCLAVFAALALKPLMKLGTIQHVSIVSLQAMSGAGYFGLSAYEIMNNIIPNIAGEEDKIETELLKILGTKEQPADFSITVHTNRIPILHGHTAVIHVRYEEKISLNDIHQVLADAKDQFPKAYQIHEDSFSPQPQLHITEIDHRAHIGRVKVGDQGHVVGLTVMGHNLVRGAAGAALLNLEAFLNYQKEGLCVLL